MEKLKLEELINEDKNVVISRAIEKINEIVDFINSSPTQSIGEVEGGK